MKFMEMFSKKTVTTPEEEREFAVEPADLQEQISIEEIEQREKVFDPMGAVPDLPFGHLHGAWQSFLSQRESDATIWTFKTLWTSQWGGKALMKGYVIKNGDEIGHHFLTIWKTVIEE